MYVETLAVKVRAALQVAPTVDHEKLLAGLTHQENVGMIDTIREMERAGTLKRVLERGADGKLILRYHRVGATGTGL